ncbi:ATP-binding protein [Sphingomonas aurantiaca]|uniref:ATP-binding protein n=1 Tax=Sphingomonas aurantiaca TaxID=185949 RepID=UPI002FE200AB
MKAISNIDIATRIARDNPWWSNAGQRPPEDDMPRRTYFPPFSALALDERIKRAVVLLGPRRVGKTVMIKQLISKALDDGWDAGRILYASIDTPVYSGTSLEQFLSLLPDNSGRALVIFDEIQYLRDWEVHLKDLVDSYPTIKFVATGSAAAALRLKSNESGAGRFTDFMLPPLTFHEFLVFIGKDADLISVTTDVDTKFDRYKSNNIEGLNSAFIDYLNYGGFPEAVLNPVVRENPDQFVRSDIIDKVLLKDLPSLYGIDQIQELNKLFTFLAYNAGNEASLDNVSKQAEMAKPTIKRYIEYLESAFLIMKVANVDQNCKSMQRERAFKVYLNNPSMRAALFNPVNASDTDIIGHLAESAVFSQWQHGNSSRSLRYARWKSGEVDIVSIYPGNQSADWAVELKWSDRPTKDASQLSNLVSFCRINKLERATCTTKTVRTKRTYGEVEVDFVPTALYCYTVGRNITKHLKDRSLAVNSIDDEELEEQAEMFSEDDMS